MEQGSVGLGVSRCVILTGRVCFSNKPPLPHHPPPPLYLDLCSTILVARSTTGLALSFTVSMSRDIVQSLSKRTFVFSTFWLKIMDFVTQTDATEVGNNFPCRKNVLQAMVSNPFM